MPPGAVAGKGMADLNGKRVAILAQPRTRRKPDDIPAFNRDLLKLLAEARPRVRADATPP